MELCLDVVHHEGMTASDLNWSGDAWRRLGLALATSRQEQGLTQAETAEKAGVARATIQNLERGRSSRLKTVSAVARALSWPVNYAEEVLNGTAVERPVLQTSATPTVTQGDLPLAVSHELKQGALIDSEVLELGEDSGARMIIVLRGKEGSTPEQIQAALLEWRRMARGMKLGETREG